MLWKRLFPEIPSDAFPRELRSATCGMLALNLNYLVLKAEGPEYVSEDRLMPGNEITQRFVWYAPQTDNGLSFAVTLHPPTRGQVDPDRWIAVFDTRFSELSMGWRQLLADQPGKITKLFRPLGEESVTGEEFVRALVLKNMNIGVDSSDGLVFEPAWPFDSLNLNVSVSHRGRVTEAHFDG